MKKPISKQLAASLILLFCQPIVLFKTLQANTDEGKTIFIDNRINIFDNRTTINTAREKKQIFSLEENSLMELPFSDDFSNEYENWKTYSTTGNLQWHISYDDGIDGSNCARIYSVVSPEINDDWLISPSFNMTEISKIKVNFYYWYYGENLTPEFYYSTNYSGDFENSDWTKIDYSFNIDAWDWRYTYFNLDVPADTFAFAFRYQSDIGDDDKVMIDNFSIEVTETKNNLTPWEAAAQMKMGINLGNTLEVPTEGGWNNPVAEEVYFDYYKDAGFDFVRVPVRWDEHMGETEPYQIEPAWLDRVEEVADWGLSRDLFVIINAHHEDWIKENYDDPNMRARLDSLWSQVANRFKDKSDRLIFEILNEPTTQTIGLTIEENDEVIVRELSIIRKTNPTRIVIFQGTGWSSSNDLFQAAVPDDDYLMGTYHSYSPYEFALLGQGTFDQEDYDILRGEFINIKNWSDATHIPVLLGEFGSMKTCDYNSRMKQYYAYVTMAEEFNVIPCAWDDGGNFEILHRQDGTWDEVKDILIYTSSESPDNLNLEIYQDSIVKVTWDNHVTDNDNIIIERRRSDETTYTQIAQVNNDVSEYDDVKPEGNVTFYYRIIAHYNNATDKYSYPQKYCFGIMTPELKISEIQGSGESSPFQDQQIKTQGRITAVNQHGFYIQDTTGARSGIFVYAPELNGQFNQADHVKLTATVDEYNGKTELKDVTDIDSTDQSFPVYITYIDGSQMVEDYEGVLVPIQGLKVVYQNKYQEYITVSSGGDSVIVDNYLIQPEMETGKTYNVQGIVDYLNGRFSLNPRAQEGIQLIETEISIQTKNATEIGTSSAMLNGEVVSDGGATITQRGFYWSSENSEPDETNNIETVAGTTGEFSYKLSGLDDETTYYFRAFASNSEGTATGEVEQFTTLPESNLAGLPFSDDFSNDYENWTHYSITGDDQWHLSGDDGIDGSKCARFYITSNPPQANDDWLISQVFNTEGVSNIAIEFKFWYHNEGPKPEFYYSNSFSGDVATTNWTELDNSFWKNEWTWNDARLEIENPGNTFVFAIRYQSTTENSEYILIDNFKISEFVPVVFEKVGTTEHFEFYTNIQGEENYNEGIQESLEEYYAKYRECWMAPMAEEYLDESIKIKVYYSLKEDVPLVTDETPEIQSGFFDMESNSVYLTPLDNEEKTEYYTNLEGLAIHTFAGFAKQKQLFRDNFPYDNLPIYYYESFGLFEQGYRTRHDSIISQMAKHPENFTVDELNSMDIFKNTSERDIVFSCVESLLILDGYGNGAPTEGYEKIWNNYLTYFHDTTDVVRIKKYGESEKFDIYCSSRDTMYMDSLKVWLERARHFWIDSFQVQINNRTNLIILYDEKTGLDLTFFDHWTGGAGGLNISPHNFTHIVAGDGVEGYPWLLAHEYSHAFSGRLGGWVPYGFCQEGLANFVAYKMYGVDWLEFKWEINDVFDYYEENKGREPNMYEFVYNPDDEVDPYFFGLQFLRYAESISSLSAIKNFFSGALDYDAFGRSKSEILAGYIEYLKGLIAIKPPELNTMDASGIEAKKAILNGEVTSGGGAEITQRGFYWNSTSTSPGSSDHVEIVEGTTGEFSFNLTGLTPETTYHFCAFASNSEGTAVGEVKEFTTLESIEKPSVVTYDATDIDIYSVSLNGEVTDDGGDAVTQRGFYWVPDTPGATQTIETVAGTTGAFTYSLTELEPGTTYKFFAFATNSVGTTMGPVKQFTTLPKPKVPSVETNDASNTGIDQSTLNGEITDAGSEEITQRGFYWSSTNPSPGASDQVETVAGKSGEFSKNLTGLQPETTYYFRAFATNEVGTGMGEVKYFTTQKPLEIPTVITGDALEIVSDGATLTGNVTTDGGAEISQRGFYWSLEHSEPGESDNVETVEGTTGEFSFALSGLVGDTTCYFRAFATNSKGTASGEVKQFVTLSTGTANTEIPDFWLKAYPNPFNSETTLVYSLHQTGPVTISVYTTEGVKISIPLNKDQESGIHRVPFSAKNLSGGIYFCRIVSEKFARTIKLVVQ